MVAQLMNRTGKSGDVQGFLTSHDRFVDREEAMQIAKAAGQVDKDRPDPILFSEDLY